jgi:hypothetical protein
MPNPGLEGIIFEIKCVLSNCNFYNFIVLKLPTKEFNPGKNCTVYLLIREFRLKVLPENGIGQRITVEREILINVINLSSIFRSYGVDE